MKPSIDRLYELLPAIYRLRDAELSYPVGSPDASPPLRELLRVIAEQVNLVEADIARLYDDWFIETCEPWVVPYIADLIGYKPVYDVALLDDVQSARGQLRERIVIPRREVAKTIPFRRRKGAASLLPELARAVAGWPAVAVEGWKTLGATQNVRHVRTDRGRTRDVRDPQIIDRTGGPFDDSSTTADVRRADSSRTRGRHGINEVALFAWRLRVDSVTQTSACCIEDVGPNCFTFSVIGNDTPLFTRADPAGPGGLAEVTVPGPIRRFAIEDDVIEKGIVTRTRTLADYYGEGKSFTIWADHWPKKGAPAPIPREQIIPADLSTWGPAPPRGFVAVDPELGRILFPANQWPKHGIRLTYHDAFSADMGGGEYDRPLGQPPGSHIFRVGADETYKSINAALAAWTKVKRDHVPKDDEPEATPFVPSAVIEIEDNGVYTEPLNITVDEGELLQIRAANRRRPVIRLLDYMADRPDAFSITATGKGARVVLDGLLVAGRGLQVYGLEPDIDAGEARGDLCELVIRHTTLVPGWLLACDCEPKRPSEPSIELSNTRATIRIEKSIVGAIVVVADEVAREPAKIVISDSIVDATSEERVAIGAASGPAAYAHLRIARSTVLGLTQVHAIELAENTIFTGAVFVARRQIGCVRFCYVPPESSRTPKRYHCEPDTAVAAALADQKRIWDRDNPGEPLPDEARDALVLVTRERVEPDFNSTRFGSPRYCQLAETCDDAIERGADDESEMGAFHDLYQPQRLANLRARLAEFAPASEHVGVFFVT